MNALMVRLTAAALAASVTLTMVWSMAALGYPVQTPTKLQLACYPASSSATLSVR
jgi:hypothetical protein